MNLYSTGRDVYVHSYWRFFSSTNFRVYHMKRIKYNTTITDLDKRDMISMQESIIPQ